MQSSFPQLCPRPYPTSDSGVRVSPGPQSRDDGGWGRPKVQGRRYGPAARGSRPLLFAPDTCICAPQCLFVLNANIRYPPSLLLTPCCTHRRALLQAAAQLAASTTACVRMTTSKCNWRRQHAQRQCAGHLLQQLQAKRKRTLHMCNDGAAVLFRGWLLQKRHLREGSTLGAVRTMLTRSCCLRSFANSLTRSMYNSYSHFS